MKKKKKILYIPHSGGFVWQNGTRHNLCCHVCQLLLEYDYNRVCLAFQP